MNIVVASSNSPYEELAYTRLSAGGAERGLRAYAEHASSVHSVTYLSTAHRGLHPFSTLIRDVVNGVSVVHVQGPSLPGMQRLCAVSRERAWYQAVLNVCRDVHADVIITYASIPDTHAAVRAKQSLRGLQVVEWMAGRSWLLHLERVPHDVDRVAEAFSGKDLTLFESGSLEAYTREQLAAWSLPPLGRTARVEFSSPGKNVARNSGPEPAERGRRPVVACIATFKPGSKRQDILIRAWPAILEQVGDAQLVFTGDGPLRDSCESLAARLGVSDSVRFLGMVPRQQIDELIASSALTVLPTEFEGRPQSILESLMACVPVVASDIPAVREALQPLGEAAERMLTPNTPTGFSDAIVSLLKDPAMRETVSRSIREHLESSGPGDDDAFAALDAAVVSLATEGRV